MLQSLMGRLTYFTIEVRHFGLTILGLGEPYPTTYLASYHLRRWTPQLAPAALNRISPVTVAGRLRHMCNEALPLSLYVLAASENRRRLLPTLGAWITTPPRRSRRTLLTGQQLRIHFPRIDLLQRDHRSANSRQSGMICRCCTSNGLIGLCVRTTGCTNTPVNEPFRRTSRGASLRPVT
jgi:hypothetical protein